MCGVHTNAESCAHPADSHIHDPAGTPPQESFVRFYPLALTHDRHIVLVVWDQASNHVRVAMGNIEIGFLMAVGLIVLGIVDLYIKQR